MYCSSAFFQFFQKHFYFSATFLLLCSISSTLSYALSLELSRGDHATSPRSRDMYSTVIGPFYFIHFNIFFLLYKLRFLRTLHPKPTLHTKFTTPCSPIYTPCSPIHARRSPLVALCSHASDPQALLASICLEIDYMGAFLKSVLSIDVKNNLKRSTLVTIKSDTTSQRRTWSDG